MPVIKIIQQNTQTHTGVTGTFNGTAIPLDGANMVSDQIVVSNTSGVSGCTIQLQISNDDLNSSPSNWTNYGTSQNITTNGVLYLTGANSGMYPPGNWIRAQIAAPTGSFDFSNTILVKGPN